MTAQKLAVLTLIIALFGTLQLNADWRQELHDTRQALTELSSEKSGTDKQRFDALVQRLYDWQMLNYPEAATYLGDPRGADRWTDQSAAAIERRQSDERLARSVLESIKRSALKGNDLLNYDLLQDQLDRAIASQQFPTEMMPINQLNGVQQDVARIFSVAQKRNAGDYEKLLGRLESLPERVDQTIALMRQGQKQGITPPRITLRDVPDQIRNQLVDDPQAAPVLKAFTVFPDSVDALQREALGVRARELYSSAVAPAYEKLLRYMEEEYLPASRESIAMESLPDGKAWYRHNIQQLTTTDLSPEEIHTLGLSEVKRLRGEMDAIIKSLEFAGSFEDFLHFLRTDPQFYHTTAEGLLAEYRDISKRADPELTRLFGHLPRAPYGVIEIPAYAAKSTTTAYYMPSSAKAGRPGYFYANTYALDTRPRWEMEALTLHEAVPGHHLQIAIQDELDDVPWFRQVPTYTAFVEGWGLYAESLGTEMGFYTDPYSKFGQLTYEMWRAIRLVVDTGMHHKGWSRQQAIDYFMANAGKQEHDVVVEIDRYIVWPGQALAYKIGELKIKELRAWATQTLGDRFDVRAFHDVVLGSGAVPLPLLESNVRAWVASQ